MPGRPSACRLLRLGDGGRPASTPHPAPGSGRDVCRGRPRPRPPSLHHHHHHYHYHHLRHPPPTLRHEAKQQQYIRKFPAYKLPETFLVHFNSIFNSRPSIPLALRSQGALRDHPVTGAYLFTSVRHVDSAPLVAFTFPYLTSCLPIALT